MIDYTLLIKYFAQFILLFTNLKIVGLILLWVYFFVDKKTATDTLYLATLSLLVNFSLKIFFKAPLLAGVHSASGFAFPSGHTQTAVVLYGYLWIYHRKLFLPFILILPLIGWAMVHMGYHTYFDVMGGFIAAFILLFAYTKFIATRVWLKFVLPIVLLGWIYYAHHLIPFVYYVCAINCSINLTQWYLARAALKAN